MMSAKTRLDELLVELVPILDKAEDGDSIASKSAVGLLGKILRIEVTTQVSCIMLHARLAPPIPGEWMLFCLLRDKAQCIDGKV